MTIFNVYYATVRMAISDAKIKELKILTKL